MTSILKVDTLQDSGGNTILSSDGAGTFTYTTGATGMGKLLQVVQGTTSTSVSTNTGGFVDTNLTANITPSATSSKVLVLVNQNVFLDRNDSGAEVSGSFRILRDGSSIFTTVDLNDLRLTATAGGTELRLGYRLGVSILDTPSTTSAITYKTQIKYVAGTQTIANRSSAQAIIILMEIAG